MMMVDRLHRTQGMKTGVGLQCVPVTSKLLMQLMC